LWNSSLASILTILIAIATDVTEIELSRNVDIGKWKKMLNQVEEDKQSDLLSTKYLIVSRLMLGRYLILLE
jgi:hypothetical protein